MTKFEKRDAHRWFAAEMRRTHPSYVWDRRHALHPVNVPITLELAEQLLDIAADLQAYQIDSEPLIRILEQLKPRN